MTLRVCPIASVHAPVRKAWSFLSQPATYALWWDARTESITPPGPAQAGQRIHATTMQFGLHWDIEVLVENVDHSRHVLDVMTSLPFGIIVFNHITCSELDPKSCQISFG